MNRVIRFIFLLILFAGAIYLFADQKRKLGMPEYRSKTVKPKGYSLEDLQKKRDSMIKDIQDGI